MALTEGGPGNWQPGSFPVPYQLDGKPVPATGAAERKPALPVKVIPAGPITLPAPRS